MCLCLGIGRVCAENNAWKLCGGLACRYIGGAEVGSRLIYQDKLLHLRQAARRRNSRLTPALEVTVQNGRLWRSTLERRI